MKKLFILSAAVLLVFAAANAQTDEAATKNDIASLSKKESSIKKQKREKKKELKMLNGKDVSNQSKSEFIRDFGNITDVTWTRGNYYDEGDFIKDGMATTAFYDDNAKLVGTIQNKAFDDLPANARNFIAKNYTGYKVRNVIFYDDNELNETDMVLFGIQFDDADNYFVELKKDNRKIIVEVNMNGEVSYFAKMY